MRESLYKAVHVFYTFLPAYFANATPTIFGGGPPIDFNRNFTDGRRIFGENKTIMGFIAGLAFGTTVGIMENEVLRGFLLSFGALVGDLAGAFIKRRAGLSPGAPLPILDQLDFIAGALILSSRFFTYDTVTIIFVIGITLILHVFTNLIAYFLKIKRKPW